MQSKPHKVIQFFFGTTFIAIINVMSIIGFVVLFVTTEEQAIIALVAFILFLIALFIRAYWVTDQFLKNKSPNGYEKLSTSAKYTCDGNTVFFELKKFIQCKQVIMNTHEHSFYWTGSKDPRISSETMEYVQTIPTENQYRKAIFKFKEPLVYNGVFVAHIKMEMDDSDKRSSPHMEQYVRERTQLISFKVQLPYKNKRVIPAAKLSRRPINSVNSPYEFLSSISFDKNTKTYEHNIFEPEVGYSYRLEWIR